jgi:hypothetical protein
MILSHEKNTVIDALEFYCKESSDSHAPARGIAGNILARLKEEHLPVGAFCHGDYKSHAQECGYDLTDEQVNDLMEYSRRTFDAGIGISWDVISIHLDLWAEENNIQKT